MRAHHLPGDQPAPGTVAAARASRRSLAMLSITDGLTGLANRRRYDEVLHREWRRTGRTGKPLALLMLDVDGFKKLNDEHGHALGDKILSALGGVIRAVTARPGDLGARYGGEEFACSCCPIPGPKARCGSRRKSAPPVKSWMSVCPDDGKHRGQGGAAHARRFRRGLSGGGRQGPLPSQGGRTQQGGAGAMTVRYAGF